MKLEIQQVDVWSATLEDRPGALAAKLELLVEAGVNLEFLIARRELATPGTGVAYVCPIKAGAQAKAAAKAGFTKSATLAGLRVEGTDKPGLMAAITRALADAGLNLRGVSAAAVGKKSITFVALDNTADARKATRILQAGV